MSNIEITATEWDRLYGDAVKVGRTVSRKYAGVIDAEDITQNIMERFVQSEASARKLIDSYEKDARVTFKGLMVMGTQVAMRDINAHRQAHANYTYTPGDVRRLLERGLLQVSDEQRECGVLEAQVNALTMGRKSKKDHTERVNYADKIDLEKGFAKLTREHREAIIKKYSTDESLTGAERMRLSRAIDALTSRMNSSRVLSLANYSGTGKRRPVSNARAQESNNFHYYG